MIRLDAPTTRFSSASIIRPLITILLFAAVSFTQAIPQAGASLSVSSITARANKAERARLSDSVSIRAAGVGAPYVSLADGRDLLSSYSGPASMVEALEGNDARPLSLASADFDEDGMPDLVAGYAGPDGGMLVLHRGNADSIYPNAPEAQRRLQEGTFTEAPFLSPALVYSVAEPADFIGAGDFDADGHRDVVTARKGSDKLYLLSGDGRGGFSPANEVELPGQVTAFAAGEINRRDGLDDLILGLSSPQGAVVMVFEGARGALRSGPEVFNMPAEASALALGQLDNEYTYDLAIGAGQELLILHGRDRRLSLDSQFRGPVAEAKIESRSMSFNIRSVTVGDFTSGPGNDIAMLGDDGAVHILSAGREISRGNTVDGEKTAPTEAIPQLSQWRLEEVGRGDFAGTGILVSTRSSSLDVDNLLVAGHASREVKILTAASQQQKDGAEESAREAAHSMASVTLDLTDAPVAALPMRLNGDALNDLVILTGGGEPVIMLTVAMATYTVSNTNNSGAGSLRQAIADANANAGLDTIRFSIGSGPQIIAPISAPLPAITDAVTIDATTQPGFSGVPIIELRGSGLGSEGNGLVIAASGSVVRGLVINGFGVEQTPAVNRAPRVDRRGVALLLDRFGSSVVEGNYIGTNASGTAKFPNGGPAVYVYGSSRNRVGGTVSQARNLLSGNAHGVAIVPPSQENRIEGNYVGANKDGNAAIPNAGEGIYLGFPSFIYETEGLVLNNTIGGQTAGATNVVSGNLLAGIGLFAINDPSDRITAESRGNVIQGNYIGTNRDGNAAIRNRTGSGILIFGSDNTVGGTTPAARNILSGNTYRGVSIGSLPTRDQRRVLKESNRNLIQGNFIGADKEGALAVGNLLDGVLIDPFSNDNTIGGADESAGNVIAFNGRNGIVLPNEASESFYFPSIAVPALRVTILNNVIFGNNLISIDLGNQGQTANDPGDLDGGANELQNYPVLSQDSASVTSDLSPGSVTPSATSSVRMSLNSRPNTAYRIQIFYSLFCPQPGVQIGTRPRLLDSLVRSTDAAGLLSFSYSFTIPEGKSTGFITATATDPGGNTSEVAPCFQITASQTPCNLTCPPNQNSTATSAAGIVVSYPQPTLSGDCTGVAVTCAPTSGTNFPVGATTVNCTAREGTTTRATCSFNVVVAPPPPPQGPQITSAVRDGKKLIVTGARFASGAVILLNGASQKTTNDASAPTTRLIGKKAGKKARPNDRVQVRNPDGSLSNEWVY